MGPKTLLKMYFFAFHRKKSYIFGSSWGWINNERICIFGWTIPVIYSNKATRMFSFSTSDGYLRKYEWQQLNWLREVATLTNRKLYVRKLFCFIHHYTIGKIQWTFFAWETSQKFCNHTLLGTIVPFTDVIKLLELLDIPTQTVWRGELKSVFPLVVKLPSLVEH